MRTGRAVPPARIARKFVVPSMGDEQGRDDRGQLGRKRVEERHEIAEALTSRSPDGNRAR